MSWLSLLYDIGTDAVEKYLAKVPKIYATLVVYASGRSMIRLVNSEPIALHSIKVRIGPQDVGEFLIKGRHTERLYRWKSASPGLYDTTDSLIYLRPDRSMFIEASGSPEIKPGFTIEIAWSKEMVDRVSGLRRAEFVLTETTEISRADFPELYREDAL